MSQTGTRWPGQNWVVFVIALAVIVPIFVGGSKSSDSPAGAGAAHPVVRITAGLAQGRNIGTQDEYLGIPYAAPPVGALRWRPPLEDFSGYTPTPTARCCPRRSRPR